MYCHVFYSALYLEDVWSLYMVFIVYDKEVYSEIILSLLSSIPCTYVCVYLLYEELADLVYRWLSILSVL